MLVGPAVVRCVTVFSDLGLVQDVHVRGGPADGAQHMQQLQVPWVGPCVAYSPTYTIIHPMP